MMPPGLAQGLQPFFDRLGSLGPIDRAFAVHFGELRATPERIFDARLAPALPPLAPEPGMAPVAVAQNAVKPTRQDDRRGRDKRKKGKPEPIQVPSRCHNRQSMSRASSCRRSSPIYRPPPRGRA